MADLDRAIAIAVAAHAPQQEKGTGLPYVLHPLRLADRLDSPEEKIVAVLHDLLEDTPWTVDALAGEGFSGTVFAAVVALTRTAGESYAAFVVRLSSNSLATAVKRADLVDNFNLPRTLIRPDRLRDDVSRLARYALSYRFLNGDLDQASYVEAMGRATAWLTTSASRSDQ